MVIRKFENYIINQRIHSSWNPKIHYCLKKSPPLISLSIYLPPELMYLHIDAYLRKFRFSFVLTSAKYIFNGFLLITFSLTLQPTEGQNLLSDYWTPFHLIRGRMEVIEEFLWMRYWTPGFHKAWSQCNFTNLKFALALLYMISSSDQPAVATLLHRYLKLLCIL